MAIVNTGSASNSAISGTAVTVTHGLTINSGDVVIALLNVNGSVTIADNNGGNLFTEDLETAGGATSTLTHGVYSRVAGASEPASYDFTTSASDRWSIVVMVFSGVDTSSIYDIAPLSGNITGTSAVTVSTSSSITTINANSLVVAWHCRDASTNGNFSSPTNGFAITATGNTNQPQVAATKSIATAGATGSVSITHQSAATSSLQFAINEATATVAAITSVGGDDVVLDAETSVPFVTSGFSSEISTVQLVSGTSTTNGSSVSSTSGTGTFSLPDITLYTGDVIGCPLTTANNIVVARLTDA